MTLVYHLWAVFTRVELVNMDVSLMSTSKEVTTVGELDLSASLDLDLMVHFQTLLEDIHHSDSVSETDDNMESRWVEGNTVGFILESLTDLKLRWIVVPYSHSLVDRASGNKIFLDAHVHALN